MKFLKKKNNKDEVILFSGRVIRPRFVHWFFCVASVIVLVVLSLFILGIVGVSGLFVYYVNRFAGFIFFAVIVVAFFEKSFRKRVFVEYKDDGLFLRFSNGEVVEIPIDWGNSISEGLTFFLFKKGNKQYPVWFDVDEKKKFSAFLRENQIKTEKRFGFSYFIIEVYDKKK